jgi:hypothetical protein
MVHSTASQELLASTKRKEIESGFTSLEEKLHLNLAICK